MFWTVTLALLDGLKIAVQIFFMTLLFALPLGLPIAFACMNQWQPFHSLLNHRKNAGRFLTALARWKPISALMNTLVWIIRGTPLILQLIVIFYGPGMWFDHNVWAFPQGRMSACILAFTINYACYFSVIYRGGIEGVPTGQREAGEVLGMTNRQIFFKITLLQMVKRIVPPMSNEIITLVKDTSLARVIAITEIIKVGEAFAKSDGITWPLFYTGVFYLLFVGILTILFNYIERRLDYFK